MKREMKNSICFISLFSLFSLIISCVDNLEISNESKSHKYEISNLYNRVYKLIEIKEYDIAFSELGFYLQFYSRTEINNFDIQNLFAKYIFEGEDSLENIVENYAKLFDFFDSSDSEAIYQMMMYKSVEEKEREQIALIVASKVDAGRIDAGLYYFLAYTFHNLNMKEQANRYLDCLISIAPFHRATSNLILKIRGKKPKYKAEFVEALKNLFYNEETLSSYATIASNFHIPAMMNIEWENIGKKLLKNEYIIVQDIAYSEIPIFFAQKGDADTLYSLLKEQILQNNYKYFSLISRSILYVYKEPYVVVERIRKEFEGHPFASALYAKYLLSLSADRIYEAIQSYLQAIEKDNNIDIFYEAADLLKKSSVAFKLKPFIEELLFKYPYHIDLYTMYKDISSNSISDEFYFRYFEQISDSPDKYLIFSSVAENFEMKKRILLEGLKNYGTDCRVLISILRLYIDRPRHDLLEVYKNNIKNFTSSSHFYQCLRYIDEDEGKRYLSLLNIIIKVR